MFFDIWIDDEELPHDEVDDYVDLNQSKHDIKQILSSLYPSVEVDLHYPKD